MENTPCAEAAENAPRSVRAIGGASVRPNRAARSLGRFCACGGIVVGTAPALGSCPRFQSRRRSTSERGNGLYYVDFRAAPATPLRRPFEGLPSIRGYKGL